MNNSIPLHPKYGLNPTIPICAFCGKEKNEIVLLGNAYKEEAPKSMVVNLEPCEECKKNLNKGITLFEISPTGDFNYAVITKEAASRLFQNVGEDLIKEIFNKRIIQVEYGLLKHIGVLP